jgi:hypothetical protein
VDRGARGARCAHRDRAAARCGSARRSLVGARGWLRRRARPVRSLELRPRAGGGHEIREPALKSARIAADGHLTLNDHPLLDVGVDGPCPSCVKEDLRGWYADPRSGRTVDLGRLLPRLRLKLNLSDGLMRRAGQDPYAANKRRIFDETHELRAGMAAVAREHATRNSLRHLEERLAALWNDSRRPAPTRRRLLFELWDECDETPAGRHARATIEAFIRRRGIRYSADELAELDRRRTSRQRFAPPGSSAAVAGTPTR